MATKVKDNKTKKDDGKKKDKTEKTYTEKEYQAAIKRAKRQGKNSVVKKFGFESEEELEESVTAFQDIIDKNKEPDEKNKEKLSKEEKKRLSAEERAEIAEAKLEAVKMGVNPDYIEEVLVIASAKKTEDNTYDEIFEEIKETEKYDVFFGESNSSGGDGNKNTNDGGTGSSMKGKDKGSEDGEEESIGAKLGAQKAEAKKAENDFWK